MNRPTKTMLEDKDPLKLDLILDVCNWSMNKGFYHALILIIAITYIIFVLLTLNIDINLASLSNWADLRHNFLIHKTGSPRRG
jgi:hypothetical protein